MRSESPWHPVRSRRSTAVSIAIAVLVHAVILVWVSRTRAEGGDARPPGAEGFGGLDAPSVATGLPMTRARNTHTFRVISEIDGRPLTGARITDLFAGDQVFTGPDGRAALLVRPAAKLVVHVEKPGFALHAVQVANVERETSYTIILEQARIPYAAVDTLFLTYCGYCHGTVGTTANLDFTSYERLMASRFQGQPIVVAPNPDSSRLVQTLVDSLRTNGKRTIHGRVTTRVTAYDIDLLAEWVRQGAHGPESSPRRQRPD